MLRNIYPQILGEKKKETLPPPSTRKLFKVHAQTVQKSKKINPPSLLWSPPAISLHLLASMSLPRRTGCCSTNCSRGRERNKQIFIRPLGSVPLRPKQWCDQRQLTIFFLQFYSSSARPQDSNKYLDNDNGHF